MSCLIGEGSAALTASPGVIHTIDDSSTRDGHDDARIRCGCIVSA